ncbi:MAG: purine-nucleoside phosphorylase [Spirochaetales bacterium]|nr:purine-nucleoside phosphorylase [Spirochaetales bacterium]
MSDYYSQLNEAASYVKERIGDIPKIAAVLGSGLGGLVQEMSDTVSIPYSEIPHYPVSTVSGHAGQLTVGVLGNHRVAMMEGRPHFYEGYTMKQVAFPTYMMRLIGVDTMVITNACGGINRSFEPGTLMIIEDFINLAPSNPLIGANDERLGPRFPDMSEPYSLELIALAENCAESLGLSPAKGVYAGFPGPYFETAAEIRSIANMGADAVGMSTVPETIAANHAGMQCFAVSCITNMATGIQAHKHSHERVLATAQAASADLGRWLSAFIRQIPA